METFALIMTYVFLIGWGIQLACWFIGTLAADLGLGNGPTSKQQLSNAWNNFWLLEDDLDEDEEYIFFHSGR